jgi:MscS family membrane protein
LSRQHFIALILMVLMGLPVFAEIAETVETAQIAETVEVALTGANSPKEAVRIFMNVMNEVENGNSTHVQQALDLLNLDELKEENKSLLAPDMASALYRVLNSFTFKVDLIPEEVNTTEYVLPIGKAEGIEIALSQNQNEKWQFDYQRTLKKINRYAETVKSLEDAAKDDTTIDPVFFSPRETMRLFMQGVSGDRTKLTEAISTLDLSSYERALRQEIGKERVAMLKAVLDRHRYIDLVELPNYSHGAPVVLLTDAVGRIVIEKVKNPDSTIEGWRFSAQTVRDLPALYDVYKEKAVVEGVVTTITVPMSVRIRDYMKKNFPGLMKQSFILENWQWLGIFLVLFVGLALGKVVIKLLSDGITLIFKREQLIIDIEAQKKFLTPINISSTALFWWIGLTLLGLAPEVRMILLVSVKVVAALSGVWAGYRLVDVIGNFLMAKAAKTENKYDDLLAPLVTRALKAMVFVFGVVFLADIFAIDIDKILAGLGLGGLAFALAAKDTISNLFGSVTILLDRPFQIGDWVTIGKADGTVESVGVRSTRIRTFYDSVISIPNSELINAQIDNYGARNYRRVTATVNIAYNTPPDKIDCFCEGIREIIRLHEYTRKDYFLIYLNEISTFSLGIMIYCFVKTPNWDLELYAKHLLFADIMRLAQEMKIEIAVPTNNVYLQNGTPMVHDNVPEYEDITLAAKRLAAQVVNREATSQKAPKKGS